MVRVTDMKNDIDVKIDKEAILRKLQKDTIFRANFSIPKPLFEEYRGYCEKRHYSMSKLITHILDAFLHGN